MITTDVENYPGFPNGIQGPELVELFRQQAVRFGAEILDAALAKAELAQRPFRLTLDPASTLIADCLVVATGANARWLELPNEQRLRGYGVSACATCDGFFFREKVVACVGGGDTAMEEALFLTRFARRVVLIHRRKEFRASRIMLERAQANPKIEFRLDTEVVDVLGEKEVTGIRVREREHRREETLPVQGLFVAIGHEPATQVFRGQLEITDHGYVRTHDITRTSVEGVFAAGDVYDHRYRQAVTAAGLGCMAALDAERYLSETPHRPTTPG